MYTQTMDHSKKTLELQKNPAEAFAQVQPSSSLPVCELEVLCARDIQGDGNLYVSALFDECEIETDGLEHKVGIRRCVFSLGLTGLKTATVNKAGASDLQEATMVRATAEKARKRSRGAKANASEKGAGLEFTASQTDDMRLSKTVETAERRAVLQARPGNKWTLESSNEKPLVGYGVGFQTPFCVLLDTDRANMRKIDVVVSAKQRDLVITPDPETKRRARKGVDDAVQGIVAAKRLHEELGLDEAYAGVVPFARLTLSDEDV